MQCQARYGGWKGREPGQDETPQAEACTIEVLSSDRGHGRCDGAPFPILLHEHARDPPLTADISPVASRPFSHSAVREDYRIAVNSADLDLIAVAFDLAGFAICNFPQHFRGSGDVAVGLDFEHFVGE